MFIPHYVLCVMCHVPYVRCHLSPFTCHKSPVTCHMSKDFFYIFFIKGFYFVPLKKNKKSGGASRWRVCYQRGLPRAVFIDILEKRDIQLLSPSYFFFNIIFYVFEFHFNMDKFNLIANSDFKLKT